MSTDMVPDSYWVWLRKVENDVAQHGENYKRMMGKDGEEIGDLGIECGHHCGVQTSEGAKVTHKIIGHCDCLECHGDPSVKAEVPKNVMPGTLGGIDLNGIR